MLGGVAEHDLEADKKQTVVSSHWQKILMFAVVVALLTMAFYSLTEGGGLSILAIGSLLIGRSRQNVDSKSTPDESEQIAESTHQRVLETLTQSENPQHQQDNVVTQQVLQRGTSRRAVQTSLSVMAQEKILNSQIANNQYGPKGVKNNLGGVDICYIGLDEGGLGVLCNRYDQYLNPQFPEDIRGTTTYWGDQTLYAMVKTPAGPAAAYTTTYPYNAALGSSMLQLFDIGSFNRTTEIVTSGANIMAGDDFNPKGNTFVGVGATGNIFPTWQDSGSLAATNTYGAIYGFNSTIGNYSPTPIKPNFQIGPASTFPSGYLFNSDVVGLTNGDWLAIVDSNQGYLGVPYDTTWASYGIRFTSSGNITNIFLLDPDTSTSVYGGPGATKVKALQSIPGGYQTVSMRYDDILKGYLQVFTQRFNATDGPVGPRIQLDPTALTALDPAFDLFTGPDGVEKAVLAWTRSSGIDYRYSIRGALVDERQILGETFQVDDATYFSDPLGIYIHDNPDVIVLGNENSTSSLPPVIFAYQTGNQPGGLGLDVVAKSLMPRIDDYVYNTDADGLPPVQCQENIPCSIPFLRSNPMASNDSREFILEASDGTLSAQSITAISPDYSNATVVPILDGISITGTRASVNQVLEQPPVFTSAPWFKGLTTVKITDGNFTGTRTLMFNPVPYQPIAQQNNPVLLDAGVSMQLDSSIFSASNPDPDVNNPLEISFFQKTQIRLTDNSTGLDVNSMPYQKYKDGSFVATAILYGDVAPFVQFSAYDPTTGLSSSLKNLTSVFNPSPTIKLGSLYITSDKTYVFKPQDLNASHPFLTFGTATINATTPQFPLSSCEWRFSNIANGDIVNATTGDTLPPDSDGRVFVSADKIGVGNVGFNPRNSTSSVAFNAAFCVPTISRPGILCSLGEPAPIRYSVVEHPATVTPVAGFDIKIPILAVAAGMATLLGIGGGVYVCHRKAQNEKFAQYRKDDKPLANWVRHYLKEQNPQLQLKLDAIADFQSEAGALFVQHIEAIADLTQRNAVQPIEQEDLGKDIAAAIMQAKVTIRSGNLILKDLGTKVEKIARLAREGIIAPGEYDFRTTVEMN